MGKALRGDNHRHYMRVSNWIRVRYKHVTKRHRLYDFSDDGMLTYFIYQNKQYAIGQFMRYVAGREVLIRLENGVRLVGYDAMQDYNPTMIEVDEYGEHIRLYEACRA